LLLPVNSAFFNFNFGTFGEGVKTPALLSSIGPKLGYRPVIEGLALMTSLTWLLIRDSAATWSRSGWLMMAISPGLSFFTKSFVLLFFRAVPRISNFSLASQFVI
jgi:hypothetical protein